jgi:hypothetical protein
LLEQHNKQQQNASRLAGPDFEVSYFIIKDHITYETNHIPSVM